jgi:tRNA (cytidine32/uridine32-2'-O)-methyltransferase
MLNNITIVMVGTNKAGNIGSAARAMKTMGVTNLSLVNPVKFPAKEADYMAVHAKDLLDNAKIFSSVEEAIKDMHFVIGTSARNRTVPITSGDVQDVTKLALSYSQKNQKIAILFGREDRGLTNEEMLLCHMHMFIHADENYGVLNIAAAVQITTYLLHNQMSEINNSPKNTHDYHHIGPFGQGWDEPLCTNEEFTYFIKHFEDVLANLGVYKKDKSPHLLLPRVKRLFKRVNLDKTEVGILRGMLTAIDKLTDKN